jgi:hypothetical protein
MRNVTTVVAIVASLAMTVSALWLWQHARALSALRDRPDLMLMSCRLSAVGIFIIAQAVIVSMLLPRLFRIGRAEKVFTICAGALGGASLLAAIAFGLAGR